MHDELNADREDQERHHAGESTDARRTEATDQWGAESQQERDEQTDAEAAEHEPDPVQRLQEAGPQRDHSADRSWAGDQRQRHRGERDVVLRLGVLVLLIRRARLLVEHREIAGVGMIALIEHAGAAEAGLKVCWLLAGSASALLVLVSLLVRLIAYPPEVTAILGLFQKAMWAGAALCAAVAFAPVPAWLFAVLLIVVRTRCAIHKGEFAA